MPFSASAQGSKTSIWQMGPSRRPCRGQSMREIQGVRTRPMKISPASVALGQSTTFSAARSSSSRTILASVFDGDEHVRGLDDGDRRLALGELQLVDGLVGDGRGHHGIADIDADMRGGGTLDHLGDGALQLVACTDLHGEISWFLAPPSGRPALYSGKHDARREPRRRSYYAP